MKYIARAAALVGVLLVMARPAEAQIAGPWFVTGKVGGFGFTLNCQFDTQGTDLTGVCTDASTSDPKVKAGKAHPLTSGSVNGNHVTWTYQSSFLLAKFNVVYTGTLNGNEMAGTIVAAGRTGNFTANRK